MRYVDAHNVPWQSATFGWAWWETPVAYFREYYSFTTHRSLPRTGRCLPAPTHILVRFYLGSMLFFVLDYVIVLSVSPLPAPFPPPFRNSPKHIPNHRKNQIIRPPSMISAPSLIIQGPVFVEPFSTIIWPPSMKSAPLHNNSASHLTTTQITFGALSARYPNGYFSTLFDPFITFHQEKPPPNGNSMGKNQVDWNAILVTFSHLKKIILLHFS